MRISKLSTLRIVSINGTLTNVIEQKASNQNLPIVPIGGKITMVELSTAATPLNTVSCHIQNMRTGVKISCSSTLYSCAWIINVPKVEVGAYRLLLNINDDSEPTIKHFNLISEIFNIVLFNDEVCEVKANDTWKSYFDGSPSVFAGAQFHYYHYFRRDYFERKIRTAINIYDDERGVSQSLLNKSYEYLNLKGVCNEYTANCIQVLSAGDFFAVKYLIKTTTVTHVLSQFDNFDNAKINNSLNKIACNYNIVSNEYRRSYPVQPQILITIGEQNLRVPMSLLCQDYANPENDYFTNLSQIIKIKFMSAAIPNNFLKSLKNSNINQIRGSNVIKEIGDNVNLDFTNDLLPPIKADFPFVQKVGKNVNISMIDGRLNVGNYSNKPVLFDNLKTDLTINAFSKTFVKNTKSPIVLTAPEIEAENCQIDTVAEYVAPKLKFKNCIFTQNSLTFSGVTELENCDLAKKESCTINLSNVKKITSSFNKNYADLTVTGTGTILERISENSFQRAKITDTGNLLGKFIAKKYRTITSTSNIYYHKIGGVNFVNQNDVNFMTDNGTIYDYSVSGINITLISTARTYEGLLNFNILTPISLNDVLPSLDFITNTFNNFSLAAPLKIFASDFVKIIKTPNCFTGVTLTNCEFYNDLPDDFDYSQIVDYGAGFQGVTFVNPYTVTNDTDGFLAAALTIYFT